MAGFIRRAKRTVYENPWLRFEAHEIVHPNGRPGEHGLVAVPRASCVVPFEDGDVWLTRQARFAIDLTVVEVVKGGAQDGETSLGCAQRELREELGFAASRWDDLGDGFEIPSIMAGAVRVYLARGLTRGATDQENVESIEAVRMPLTAALDAVAFGDIGDTLTALALYRVYRALTG